MPNGKKVTRKLRAILSADVKGYSLLMTDDEIHTIQTLKEYRQIMSERIQQHSGRVVDSPGDNLLAEFESSVDAVECSVDIQKRLKKKNERFVEDKRLQFRIGVNIGDIVQDGKRIYGSGVNVASRIEGLADPGGVSISRSVYDQIKDKLTFGYEYFGDHEVKNIKDPVRVYKILMDSKDAGKIIGEKSRQTAKRLVLPLFVLAAIIFTSLIWHFYQKLTTPDFEPVSVENMAYPLPDNPSIAVLPFDNMSDDPKQEYFSDGITENIITALSKVRDMFVISRNSTFFYKGKSVKIQQVAEELGVRYILEGSVQKTEDNVRITAQLIDAVTGMHIWAERYDRDLTDLFALQDEITMKIVTALRVKLTEGEDLFGGGGTDNLDAYLKYLQARKIGKGKNKENNAIAQKLVEEAIALDSQYADAYLMLSATHLMDIQYGLSESPRQSLKIAEELVHKNISLIGDNADATAFLGRIYLTKRQYDKAIAEGKRAVDMAPNSAFVHAALAYSLKHAGMPEEAIVQYKKAIRLSPVSDSWYLADLGNCYGMLGRYEEAITAFRKAINISPESPGYLAGIAAMYFLAGREEEARSEIANIMKKDPKYTLQSVGKGSLYKDSTYSELVINALRKAGLPGTSTPPLPDKPSIAVLPFDNLSDDPEQGYLSDGITEDIITDLSKIKGLLVISRNSTFTYKGKDKKIPEIAKELNVRYVLEGSVRRAGDQMRITAQLIDAKTDHHVWGERFDNTDTFQNIFELQDKITKRIVSALAVKLSIAEENNVSLKETTNMIAYDSFLKGKDHFNKMTPDDLIEAVVYFEQAIKIDPNYSRAYAALGMTYNSAWDFGFNAFFKKFNINYGTARLKAIHYLKLAMRNPTYEAYSFAAEVELYLRNYKKMINYAEKAISIAPNAADANLLLGRMFLSTSRPEKAIEYCNIAIKLDPNSIDTFAEATIRIGIAYFHLEHYEQAVEFIEKGLAIKPKMSQLYSRFLAASYAFLGRKNEAKKALKDWLKYWPSGTYPSFQKMYGWWKFKNEEVFDRLAKGLVMAGLPGDPSDYYKVVEENKLTGKEIRETFNGHTMTGFTSWGAEYWLKLDEEGNYNLESIWTDSEGNKREYLDKGKSWIEGDMMCRQYENYLGGFANCYEYYRNPRGNAETKSEYLELNYIEMKVLSVVD